MSPSQLSSGLVVERWLWTTQSYHCRELVIAQQAIEFGPEFITEAVPKCGCLEDGVFTVTEAPKVAIAFDHTGPVRWRVGQPP